MRGVRLYATLLAALVIGVPLAAGGILAQPPPAPTISSGPANPTKETSASFVFSDIHDCCLFLKFLFPSICGICGFLPRLLLFQ